MRVLQEEDREALIKYVKAEPEMNLFLLGDLENYGICSENVNFYVHEENGSWNFVILRFYQFYILYSQQENYNREAAIAFLSTQEVECISGKTVLLEKIADAFPQWKITSTYMSRCNQIQCSWQRPQELSVRTLVLEDVPEAIDLLCTIEEFADTYANKEKAVNIKRMQEEMEQGGKKVMGGYVDGKLVAIAETSAENSESAMIVGVATDIAYREKGYASIVVSALCEDCFKRGMKFLCLFYNNPKAGKIYQKIGFTEVGTYGMMR